MWEEGIKGLGLRSGRMRDIIVRGFDRGCRDLQSEGSCGELRASKLLAPRLELSGLAELSISICTGIGTKHAQSLRYHQLFSCVIEDMFGLVDNLLIVFRMHSHSCLLNPCASVLTPPLSLHGTCEPTIHQYCQSF